VQSAIDVAPVAAAVLPKLDIPPLAPRTPPPDPSGYPEKWLSDRRVDAILRQKEADRQSRAAAGEPPVPVPGETYAAEDRGLAGPQPPPPPEPFNPLQAAVDAAGHQSVLPPKPDDPNQPAVAPATGVEPPKLDTSGLPGTSTETATGALDFTTYMKKIKEAYPDLDFSNPKQAEADANARRDLDRTAMLAQLSLAAGMVKGAGVQWQGIGQGFENAGATYDKGYQKYQQALQDSADRYGKQMESQMTYDTARRQQALSMYTSAQTQAHEDARTMFTEKNKRDWEIYQETNKREAETVKMSHEDINKFFDKFGDQYKPPSDPSMMDPDMLAKNEKINRQIMAAREASIRLGKIYLPSNLMNVADK